MNPVRIFARVKMGGDKRSYTPRGDRPNFNRDDRPPRRDAIATMHARPDVLPTGNLATGSPIPREKVGGEKRPYTPRGEGFRKDGDRPRGDRPFSARPSRDGDRPRGDRPERKFGGDRSSRAVHPIRGPRKDQDHPIVVGIAATQNRGRSARIVASVTPVRPGTVRAISTSRALNARATIAAARNVRASRVRAKIVPPKFDRPRRSHAPRPEGRTDWQEHPRSEAGDDRPRRENEDDSKIFAKRPAFGGRGAYRERKTEFEKRGPQPPKVKKSGERIAKVMARAGLASRRDAEEMDHRGPRHRQR